MDVEAADDGPGWAQGSVVNALIVRRTMPKTATNRPTIIEVFSRSRTCWAKRIAFAQILRNKYIA